MIENLIMTTDFNRTLTGISRHIVFSVLHVYFINICCPRHVFLPILCELFCQLYSHT